MAIPLRAGLRVSRYDTSSDERYAAQSHMYDPGDVFSRMAVRQLISVASSCKSLWQYRIVLDSPHPA